MPSLAAGQWIVTHFSCTVGLQLFLLFLSYQDPIQLDIAEVETALFNVKIASDLAVSQILTRRNCFLTGLWRLDFLFFIFLRQRGHCGTPLLAVQRTCQKHYIVNFFFGKHKIRICTFDIQMLFLNKVYVLVFFFPGFVSLAN